MAINPQYDALLVWMGDHYITFRNLGLQLGVSAAYARILCCQERISHHWHEKLVALGFPQDLLPRAEDVRRGVRPGNRPAPIFPGLKKSKVQAQAQ